MAADFSAPYDPDFAQPARKSPEPNPSLPQGETPEASPGSPAKTLFPSDKPFLLLERTDPGHLFETSAPTSPLEPKSFLEFEGELKPFEYSQQRYNAVREKIERGIEPGGERQEEYISPFVSISSMVAPKPPPPELELPTYGTSLSVTGRKVIGFTFQEKRFLQDQATTGRPQTTT